MYVKSTVSSQYISESAFPLIVMPQTTYPYTQGFTLVLSFIAYLVYPPLCLSIDRHLNALAIQVHTDVLSALDKDRATKEGMMHMNEMTAPPAACWFWSLPPNTPFRDVVLAMRADDTFHATLNEIAAEVCVCCSFDASFIRHTNNPGPLHPPKKNEQTDRPRQAGQGD